MMSSNPLREKIVMMIVYAEAISCPVDDDLRRVVDDGVNSDCELPTNEQLFIVTTSMSTSTREQSTEVDRQRCRKLPPYFVEHTVLQTLFKVSVFLTYLKAYCNTYLQQNFKPPTLIS